MRAAAALVLLLGAPIAVHLATISYGLPALTVALIAVQAIAGIAAVLLLTAGCANRWVIGAAVLMLALGIGVVARLGVQVAPGIPHAMAYAALLALFTASLMPGREAIITVLARQVRGAIPPEIVTYTRRVTVAWAGFFTAQIAASIILALLAPLAIWSLFVNVLNLPHIAVMFAAEYAYRRWHLANHTHESITDIQRLAGRFKAVMNGHTG